jgi:hypothetical protein
MSFKLKVQCCHYYKPKLLDKKYSHIMLGIVVALNFFATLDLFISIFKKNDYSQKVDSVKFDKRTIATILEMHLTRN